MVHVSDESIIEDINKTAARLDPDVSELGMTDLSVTDSACISVPGIKEAKVRFECILERHLPFQNDSGETTTDLIIGRVVCFHLNDQVYDADKGYIRTDELKPAARLAGMNTPDSGRHIRLSARPEAGTIIIEETSQKTPFERVF